MSTLPLDTAQSERTAPGLRIGTAIRTLLYTLFAAELLFFLFYRIVNLDEGWYLWAGKLVLQGELPYRDFAYTQTPLLPYVYGLFGRIWGEGLYQGRILSSLLCLATLFLCTRIAERRARHILDARMHPWAALGCLILFGTTAYAVAHLTYTATYALATFWLALALYVTVLGERIDAESPPLGETVRLVLATGLMCLAVATRMSAVAALPPLALYLVLTSQRPWRAFAIVSLTGLGLLLLLLGPFWVASDGRMAYHIFGFHTDRITSTQRQIEKAWHTTRDTFFLFGVPLALAALGGALDLWSGVRSRGWGTAGWRSVLRRGGFEWTLLGMVILPWVLHLVPRTTASYYNTLQMPILCILGGLGMTRVVQSIAVGSKLSVAGGFGALAVASAVLNLAFNGYGIVRDELVRVPPRNQIAVVRSAAEFLREADVVDGRIITLNAHLALEAGLDLPEGYEMAIFAYRPTWSTEHALRYSAVNNELLLRDLRAGADAVAITDFDLERFYGERQQIFEAMWTHYRFAKTVPNFDPFGNNLYIYLRPQFGEPQFDVAHPVALSNGISLLGYDLDTPVLEPNGPLRLGLYWQAPEVPGGLEKRYTIFVHLLDEAGQQVAGWDNPPCRTVCPTDSWLPGEIVRDDYVIHPPEALAPGTYFVRVGMYDSETGEPTLVLEGEAPLGEAHMELGAIRVE